MSSPVPKYLTGYLIRFALGTLLVLCLISAVRMTRYREQMQQYKTSGRADNNPAEKLMQYPDKLVYSLLQKYAPQMLEDKPATTQPSAETPDTAPATPTVVTGQTPASPYSESLPTTASGGSATPSPMPAMPEIGGGSTQPSPAPSPASATASAPQVAMPPTGEWGVTADNNTPIYTLKGKLRTHTKAGKVFGIVKHTMTPKGEFLICALPGKPNIKFVLKPEDTITYKCDYNAISAEQRNLCKLQARLTAAIATRKEQLRQQAENRNPYAAQYHRALADYKKFAAKNNALLKEYNSSTGARRMQVADKLRILKDEGVRKRETFNSIKSKYKNWQQNNATADINFDDDPKIIKLKQKLAEVEHKLANP